MRRLPAIALALGLACTPPPEKPVERFGFTPRWAYQPWISKDISTGADTFDFVGGFEARDIPVGVVVLDSPWETNYNTFIPNPSRYPDFEAMVENLHGRNVRTVLWITQMLNDGSFDLEVGGDTYMGRPTDSTRRSGAGSSSTTAPRASGGRALAAASTSSTMKRRRSGTRNRSGCSRSSTAGSSTSARSTCAPAPS